MQRLLTLFAIALIAACATGAAQSQNQSQSDDGPPLIAGRIALAEGDVQIWRAEEDADGAWDVAQVNDVVTVATGLYTGANSRTELRVGPNTFRLSSGSRGGFGQLDYSSAVFNLEYGSLNVVLTQPLHGELSAVTVDGTRIDLAAPGRYRIDAGNGGQTRITVFNGYGNVVTGANPINVGSGQALLFGAGLSNVVFEQASSTAFDQWAVSRDERYRDVRSAQYVSPYMTGYEELDNYGDWIPDANYGNVWVPRAVPAGWAPYRSGQWRWVRPWGWTWVDQAPWGYAPFHYGRWVTIGNRWCWTPGGRVARPVWAPALVGFVGGSNVNVSIGFGGPVVGWYPLAPWDRYRPHYPHNNRYVTVINQTVINNPPRGAPPHRNHEGATMVPGPRFREPVMKVALPVRSNAVAELTQVAPPPRNISPIRRVADDTMVRRPNQVQPSPSKHPAAPAVAGTAGSAMAPSPARTERPTRVMPPMVADPIPNRGVNPQPPLPGNDPRPLAQPPKFTVPPTAIQTTPPTPRAAAPEVARPQPRARSPQELLPQAEQDPRGAPAEPARTPPGAPPVIRQPKVPVTQNVPAPRAAQSRAPAQAPAQARAPAPIQAPVHARAPAQVQARAPAPVQQAPVARAPAPAPAAIAQPAPRADPPRGKEQVAREVSRPNTMAR